MHHEFPASKLDHENSIYLDVINFAGLFFSVALCVFSIFCVFS